MLTRQLIRFRVDGDRLSPRLLKATPAVRQLADELIAHWRDGVGRMRGELEDAESAILHGSRQLLVGRGLSKVLTDACAFSDPAGAEELRERAFAASFAGLRHPPPAPEEHAAAVAAALALDPADLPVALYADLPDRAVLREVPAWTADGLIGRYNLALCQGLLLGADELRVHVRDADRGLHRRLVRALARRRLCAEVSAADAGGLYLSVSGPGAVLEQRSAYGLQLAQWLPALCCARAWSATASVVPPRAAVAATLELGSDLGLPGDLALLDWVPAELRAWLDELPRRLPGWEACEPVPVVLPGGSIVLPDLAMRDAVGMVQIELFHRWHARQLAVRLDQIRSGACPGLLIGVDRALGRLAGTRALLDDPLLAERGFLFSDLPAPRALGEALARLRG